MTLHGKPVKASTLVRGDEEFLVRVPEPAEAGPQPEEIELTIVHEDDVLLVVDKPRGMVVHPAPGSEEHTLVNALLARGQQLSLLGGADRPGIVHRLDRHTSGVLVVAKDDATHTALKAQLAARQMDKDYIALVNGKLPATEGSLEVRLDRHPVNRKKRAVVEPGGRQSVSSYRVREELGAFSAVEVKPHTGRTHQIRVHLAHLKCPIVGDSLYGGRKPALAWARRHGEPELTELLEGLSGQALHARRLGFRHPATGRPVSYEAPLPADMQKLLDHLREESCGEGPATAKG